MRCQKKVREALLTLASTLPDSKGKFGAKDQIDPVPRLIGSASAWGGNPSEEAIYVNFTAPKNDGAAVSRLTARDVPVDGFWSVILYDAIANGEIEAGKITRPHERALAADVLDHLLDRAGVGAERDREVSPGHERWRQPSQVLADRKDRPSTVGVRGVVFLLGAVAAETTFARNRSPAAISIR